VDFFHKNNMDLLPENLQRAAVSEEEGAALTHKDFFWDWED